MCGESLPIDLPAIDETALPQAFFQRPVLDVAPDLLGRVVVARLPTGLATAAGTQEAALRLLVLETEAYHESERGAHAYGGRRTPRNAAMFQAGGIAYVYFVYGMHWQFNVVTGREGTGEAVLIRAGLPLDLDTVTRVRARRGFDLPGRKPPSCLEKWVDGPAKLTQALGIDRRQDGQPLRPDQLVWFQVGVPVPADQIVAGPRVGIDYAGEDAQLPWRFRWIRP
ncbi:MAG: DNA-3-methyladenine glycosylase [Myxococcota bacterium]